MKKCLQLFSAAFLIFAFSILSPFGAAMAQSPAGQIPDFRVTKKLLLEYGDSKVDVTTLYYSYLFRRSDVSWSNSCSRFITRSAAESSYKKAIYGNGDWIITNSFYKNGSTNIRYVTLYWTESKAKKQILEYSDYYGYHFRETGFRKILLSMSSANSFQVTCDSSLEGVSTPLILSRFLTNPYGTTETFLSTPDYELSSILKDRNIHIPKSLQDEILPDFEYEVVDKKITIKHLKDRDRITLDAFSDYTKDGWHLVDNTYQLIFTVQKRRGGEVIFQQAINAGGSFSVDVPDYQEYMVVARYSAKACYSYGPESSTPDYCINAFPKETERVKYKERYMYIKVDGQKHSGSTVTSVCLEGFCEEYLKPKYEDCSKYDVTIAGVKMPSVGSIACALRNSFTWFINDLILPFIIPKSEDVQKLFGDLTDFTIDRLGFVALPFTFIKGVLTTVEAMTSNNDTCAISLTVFGSTSKLEMCKWRHQLPAVWSFMQIFLQGGIAIGFLWTCYRLLMQVFGVPVGDYEESESEQSGEVRWHDDRTGETGPWERRGKK